MYAQPELESSDEQDQAFELFQTWFNAKHKAKPIFKLGGYAGCGKSTMIARRTIPYLQTKGLNFAVATFTGKAASVLATKGVANACTIHSLMYRRSQDHLGNLRWVRRESLGVDFVIIDEASMVSQAIKDDLESYGVPIKYVGDNAQLPPVGQDAGIMDEPDFQLTEIHRQALRSPIIRLAAKIRQGRFATLPICEVGDDEFGRVTIAKTTAGFDPLAWDMMLCPRNFTRHKLNASKRKLLGHTGVLAVGDSIICLKNDRASALRNGTIVRVTDIFHVGSETATVSLVDELTGEVFERKGILTSCFGQKANPSEWFGVDELPFDYAYAITVHKFQGSQARRVVYIDEYLWQAEAWRLRYTGFTRAEFDLHVVVK